MALGIKYIFLAFVICTSDTLYHCIVPLVDIYHGSIFWCQAKHITHGICDNASYFCLKPHASLLNHAQHAILDTLSYTRTKVNCYHYVEAFTLRLYLVRHIRKVVILIYLLNNVWSGLFAISGIYTTNSCMHFASNLFYHLRNTPCIYMVWLQRPFFI